jgi:hypothetical protein
MFEHVSDLEFKLCCIQQQFKYLQRIVLGIGNHLVSNLLAPFIPFPSWKKTKNTFKSKEPILRCCVSKKEKSKNVTVNKHRAIIVSRKYRGKAPYLYMKVSDQFHASAALFLEKEPLIVTG